MAVIRGTAQNRPLTIKKFLGLRYSNVGDTQLELGESGNMFNFYITNDFKLKKMYGYKTIKDFNSPKTSLFSGIVKGVRKLFIVANKKVYVANESDITADTDFSLINFQEIGNVANNNANFFMFGDKVYLLNGKEYKCYDGDTFKDVEGYIPKVYISTKYDGTGTEYEHINLLTPKKHQTFNGDGEHKTFQLAEKEIESVYKVYVNGVLNSDYTSNLVNGTITFNIAPTKAMDNIDIYWSKENEDRHFIESMKAGIIYGGAVDTRVFLYGSEEEPNRIRYSAVTDKLPSVEYFPGVNQIDIGSKNFEVTDLRRHYDRLIATTNKPEAYYLTLDTIDVNGFTTPSLRTLPLNEVHGNVAFNQGQVLNNDVYTLEEHSIVRWSATNVRDERNAIVISEPISKELNNKNLRQAKTIDLQKESQYWVVLNNIIYIYNYFNKTFSKIILPVEIESIVNLNSKVLMTTKQGKLILFDEKYQRFGEEIIKSHWEMNFYDFGAEYLRKSMRKLWILMQPQAKSSVVVGVITNRNENFVKKRIEYNLLVLEKIDFNNFSFKISQNPQPFKLKLKAKKFTNLKITLDNNEETDATILGIDLKVIPGGESK